MMTPSQVGTGVHIAQAFSLKLEKKDITSHFANRLIRLQLIDNLGPETDQLEIELDDSDGQLRLPQRGEALSLELGWQGQALNPKGVYIVDEIEHRGALDVLVLRARSVDFRTTMNVRREASYHQSTLGAIVTSVAQRHSLEAKVAASLYSIPIDHIDQSEEPDLAFLTRLGQRTGTSIAVKDGKILVLKGGAGTRVGGQPLPVNVLERTDGDRHYFCIADRNAYTGVSAKWLDTTIPQQQTRKLSVQRHSATQTRSDSVETDKKNEASDAASGEYMVGDPANVLVLTTIYASKAQATRAAQAKWSELQRLSTVFSLRLAMGRADLIPEMPIKVLGFKRVIDQQQWIISRVAHELNDSGFTTTVQLVAQYDDSEYVVKFEDY